MSQISKDHNGQPLPVMVGAFGTNYPVTAGATSSATSAFAAGTTLVRVAVGNVDTGVYMAQGTSPTATSSGILLPSGSITYVSVSPGQKLAFLAVSGTSVPVSVTELL